MPRSFVPIGAAAGLAVGGAIAFIFNGPTSAVASGMTIGAGIGGLLMIWQRRRARPHAKS